MPNKKSDNKSKRPIRSVVGDYIKPPEYQQRHIATLKKLSEWTKEDNVLNFKHNRMLQNGFLERDPHTVVQDAILSKEEWLTDFACPSVEVALTLNIARKIIMEYTVGEDDYNSKTHEIYKNLLADIPDIKDQLKKEIENAIQLLKIPKDPAALSEIQQQARLKFKEKYPNKELDAENQPLLEAFERIEEDRAKRKLTHSIVAGVIDFYIERNVEKFGLEEKPFFFSGENRDRVYIGPAGSGKSSLIHAEMDEREKENLIILSTDAYRGISIPDEKIAENEGEKTDQIFVKTQDSSYLLKDLIKESLSAAKARPDTMIDCVSLETWQKKMLLENQETLCSVVALDDISLAASRAYRRAVESSEGKDAGRQIETTSLLAGHARGSKTLFTNLPNGIVTNIYDSNVKKGEKPKLIAKVDNREKPISVEIYNLERMVNILGKSNINPAAIQKGELYFDKTKKRGQFIYSTAYKVEAILQAVKAEVPSLKNRNPKPNVDMHLKSKSGVTFAILKEEKGSVVMYVKEPDILQAELLGKNRKLLEEMLKQVKLGGLEKAQEFTFLYGKKLAAKVVVDEVFKPKSRR